MAEISHMHGNGAESVDDRRIGFLRFILAAIAVVIIAIDPSEPDRYVELTYATLVTYLAYSAVIYLLSVRRHGAFPFAQAHWIDVAWFSLLVSLSSGTNSIFFFFYVFAIQVASFKRGFRSGLAVTVISAAAFLGIASFTFQPGENDLNRLLLRPSLLLIIGYLLAFWGGRELLHRGRLGLLSRVATSAVPAEGSAGAIEAIMKEIRRYYSAEGCLLVFRNDDDKNDNWFELSLNGGEEVFTSDHSEAANTLIEVPGAFSIAHLGNEGRMIGSTPNRIIADTVSNGDREVEKAGKILFDLIGEQPYATAPLMSRNQVSGRLFVFSPEKNLLRTDPGFLRQIAAQMGPVVENLRLMESLATGALSGQRRKISYDIHDGTIQPYIGLKLGLEALEMNADEDSALRGDIRKLISLADDTISDLRNFVRDLKDETDGLLGDVLVSALEQQALKFEENYGIRVDVDIDDDLRISDKLAAELFQMTAEGLSNVRRHTGSKLASVSVKAQQGRIVLGIKNHANAKAPDFVPRSITGRASSLGGTAEVTCSAGETSVVISVPTEKTL